MYTNLKSILHSIFHDYYLIKYTIHFKSLFNKIHNNTLHLKIMKDKFIYFHCIYYHFLC